MRPRNALLVVAAVALLGAGGTAFSVAGARRHARQSVSAVAHAVPGARGSKVAGCARHGRARLDCRFAITIRALSGGTITCTGAVRVKKGAHGIPLRSSFPGKPRCARSKRP